MDPASIAIIWQAIAAGLLAGIAGVAFFWRKIKMFLKRIFKGKEKAE